MHWLVFFDSAILAAVGWLLFHLTFIGKAIMSLQNVVDALTAQVAKVKAEVLAARDALTAKLGDVQAQLDAAGVPAEQVDLSELAAAVKDLDDINPDPLIDFPDEPAEPADEPTE